MFEYTKPMVEIISFTAREQLATAEATLNNEITLGKETDLSFGETVETWN